MLRTAEDRTVRHHCERPLRGTEGYDAGTDAVHVSVRGTDTEEVTGYWQALVVGGTVRAELAPAGYAPLYGMVTDRFGVTWVLDVLPPYTG
ncbi:VOC family protein [Modestobacter muralis]|uniref:VOC family protein n=1 Tax=Modestobacter muralis TaxID=1608614 RepID=UPI001FEA27FF|nr:VOC family protein [Modestobacter muralis]